MKYQLKTRQVCLFFIAFLPITKLLVLPSVLSKIAGEDLWISTLLWFVFDLITLVSIIFTLKKTNLNVFQLVEFTFGKKLSKVVYLLYAFIFMVKGILPINDQKHFVELTLYTLMPTVLYFLPFFIVAFYICLKKLRVLGRASDVLFIITVLGCVLLFSLSFANTDFTAILPIGAHGVKNILLAGYKGTPYFQDAIYLAFFIGQFNYDKKDGGKIILSYLAGAILVIAFTVIFYCIFTSIAYRQNFALTEISKYTTVINNLGRFDYIGVFMVLFSSTFALTLPLYFACVLINKAFNFKVNYIAPILVFAFEICFVVFLEGYFYSIQKIITDFFSPIFIIAFNILPALLPLTTLKEKKIESQKW